MIRCQNCGENNSKTSNFCRFCGTKFNQFQQSQEENYDQFPPRPYSWKTGEFQANEHSARPTQQIDRFQQLEDFPHNNANKFSTSHLMSNQQMQMQPQYQNTLSTGYHCPYCNSNAMPIVVKKVSAAGWAVFTVLLITTFILFWIGLLIQEERRICPSCNMRIS
jgi:DNA-directed RNA polymerase subunit RPC12/RpoP